MNIISTVLDDSKLLLLTAITAGMYYNSDASDSASMCLDLYQMNNDGFVLNLMSDFDHVTSSLHYFTMSPIFILNISTLSSFSFFFNVFLLVFYWHEN